MGPVSASLRRSIGWPAYVRWLVRCWLFSRRHERAIDRLIAESASLARTREENRAAEEQLRRTQVEARRRRSIPPTHRENP